MQKARSPFRLPSFRRFPRPGAALRSQDRMKMKVLGREGIQINRSSTDLRYLEQLADPEQLAALAYLLRFSAGHLMNGARTLQEIVDQLEETIDRRGLATLSEDSYLAMDLCRPPQAGNLCLPEPVQRSDIYFKTAVKFFIKIYLFVGSSPCGFLTDSV